MRTPLPGPRDQRVRIQTVFCRVHCSKAEVDFSAPPNPDCFQPPKGVVMSPSLYAFTETTPAWIPRARRKAASRSRVHTEAASPYSVAFARRTASVSDAKVWTVTTGPKSSRVRTSLR